MRARLPVLLLLALAGAGAVGCGTESAYACHGGSVCTLEADGDAEMRVDELGVTVGVSDLQPGDVAVTVDGMRARVARGDTARIGGLRVTATVTGRDHVALRIVRAVAGG
ncbi:hypothetical protein [Patulibacter sp. SYSU D01012]|uniref:hypothetical protein n=1 Tax=Patulibacter sp. SYSU D01012 TaxID=2817381 RepID=UPI001B30E4FD|nr:hypothetical protein [Patulibacter sp. SYSU D01012]